jgi:hypothetical protein
VAETPKPDFLPILRILTTHEVDFILVGGVAAVVQGAPIMTLDLDVLYSPEAMNLTRLLRAIEDLDGYYRMQPEKRLKPQLSHLAAGGHNLLSTRLGPLDLLGNIGKSRTYQDLAPHTIRIYIGPALSVPVLDLETIIAVKEEVGGEKDRAMLPVLRRTLEEARRR